MTNRENYLRTARFERPDSIPMQFHVNPACWHAYPQHALQELMVAHPYLFSDFEKTEEIEPVYAPNSRAGEPYRDPWGCVWETTENGILGAVTQHPLADWPALESFTPPDPADHQDWQATAARLAQSKAAERIDGGGLDHGHTFLRACDIRGYENVIMDMVDEEPRLWHLLEMIEAYNAGIVSRFLDLDVELMSYAEDLGMQVGPMLSPDLFRTYIKPSYQRLMAPAREAGCVIHMHSDGDIRTLVDDLTDAGVDIVNLQDLVNGLDWIKAHLAGKVCIELDIDRQKITRFGTPAEIDALIHTEVATLGSKDGGLMFIFGLYPGTPLENVKALMDAMERYAGYYA